jgi:hypothetical protein
MYVVFCISTLFDELVFCDTLLIQRRMYNMYSNNGRFYLHLAEVVRRMRLHPKITPYPMFHKILLIWQNPSLVVPPKLDMKFDIIRQSFSLLTIDTKPRHCLFRIQPIHYPIHGYVDATRRDIQYMRQCRHPINPQANHNI